MEVGNILPQGLYNIFVLESSRIWEASESGPSVAHSLVHSLFILVLEPEVSRTGSFEQTKFASLWYFKVQGESRKVSVASKIKESISILLNIECRIQMRDVKCVDASLRLSDTSLEQRCEAYKWSRDLPTVVETPLLSPTQLFLRRELWFGTPSYRLFSPPSVIRCLFLSAAFMMFVFVSCSWYYASLNSSYQQLEAFGMGEINILLLSEPDSYQKFPSQRPSIAELLLDGRLRFDWGV